MRTITLEHAADADGFFRELPALIAAGIDPSAIEWNDGTRAQHDLFGGSAAPAGAAPEVRENAPVHPLPAMFTRLARQALMHETADRFVFVHRYSRALGEDPRRWRDTLHPDRLRLERMVREVRREIHKMHAFVRFRPLADEQGERHVAWFEPVHHVVRAAAPHFAKRFASMRWAILTPDVSVEWNGDVLQFGPPARRGDAPGADAGEAIWLAYYRTIFNPARVKVAMMRREMPRRFWHNLPEATQITELLREAPARCRTMVAMSSKDRPRVRAATTDEAPADGRGSRVMADDPASRLESLRREAAGCLRCPFAVHSTQMVWGQGRVGADLMLVGEQPGDQEDLVGEPFVGPAGRLLRNAIGELGWPKDKVYVTNAVKHFKFELRGKRRMHKTPAQREADACSDWLEREIALVAPKVIIALGATAARSVMGRVIRIREQAGSWVRREDGLRVLIVHHPAALLRQQGTTEIAYEDWVHQLSLAGEFITTD